MIAVVKSTALHGLEGYIVEVEVDIAPGLPSFDIVGLPDTSIREAKDRVRAAVKNTGLEFPVRRITVNLAPADHRKEGPLYDLPIAVGILAATGQLPYDSAARFLFWGELSLNGLLRGVNGVLPSVLAAREAGFEEVVVPAANAAEASLVEGVKVYPAASLGQVVAFLRGEVSIAPYLPEKEVPGIDTDEVLDLADVKGQQGAKRALEVAAAGGHNVLMIGSPGSGKTMLARRLPGILPGMSSEEALEVTKIYSLAGLLEPGRPLVTRRPFRSPHHTASVAGLVGGGRSPRPGEVSLAHCGVLFLDEMPEFPKEALEALRQPLEDGVISLSRANSSVVYPARIMLVGAANPCPCGFYGDRERPCNCTPYQVSRYLKRLSGPLLDRIDICVEVPRLTVDELSGTGLGESSARVRERVEKARQIQRRRFGDRPRSSAAGRKIYCNAQMGGKDLAVNCRLTKEASSLLREAFARLCLSARTHDKILKVARTVADLEGAEEIEVQHVAEALQYSKKVPGT